MKSKCALPTVTMPSVAFGDATTWRSIELSRANARTASSFAASRASIASEGRSVARTCSDPTSGGGAKSTGSSKSSATRSRSTVMPDSTTSLIALKPTHAPEKRDSAQPYNPNSRYSATLAGCSTGIDQACIATSDWCGIDEDTQPWSSPATTSTPPAGLEPNALPCLSASPERSTPGPLPYHIANTPSTVRSGSSATRWVPRHAVAARSSLIAGRNSTPASFSSAAAFHICWSIMPSGLPR
jgi:hypothetical protein